MRPNYICHTVQILRKNKRSTVHVNRRRNLILLQYLFKSLYKSCLKSILSCFHPLPVFPFQCLRALQPGWMRLPGIKNRFTARNQKPVYSRGKIPFSCTRRGGGDINNKRVINKVDKSGYYANKYSESLNSGSFRHSLIFATPHSLISRMHTGIV